MGRYEKTGRYHKPALKAYVREKIKVLKELNITLTDGQIKHIQSLKSELQVDNYAHDLIMGTD